MRGGGVYRYVYAGNFSNVSPRGWMGAYHGAEMPMVFGTHGVVRGVSGGLERRTAEVMQDVWVRFVATGGRGVGVDGWADGEGVDGGRVVEFGRGVPARVVDTAGLEARCREMGLA
jgi:carboxylesterase type B